MNDGQKGSLIHEQWNLIKACKIEFLMDEIVEIRKFIFKFGASRFSYQFPLFCVEKWYLIIHFNLRVFFQLHVINFAG